MNFVRSKDSQKQFAPTSLSSALTENSPSDRDNVFTVSIKITAYMKHTLAPVLKELLRVFYNLPEIKERLTEGVQT